MPVWGFGELGGLNKASTARAVPQHRALLGAGCAQWGWGPKAGGADPSFHFQAPKTPPMGQSPAAPLSPQNGRSRPSLLSTSSSVSSLSSSTVRDRPGPGWAGLGALPEPPLSLSLPRSSVGA